MDKLKPILAHKFWILFGLAMLVPFIGWWMAVGAVEAKTAENITAIDGKFSSVPSGQLPNQDWVDNANNTNKILESRLKESSAYLWDQQKSLMVWPPSVEDLMEAVPYWGEPSSTAKTIYRDSYSGENDRIWRVVQPWDPQTGTGLVELDKTILPQFPENYWAGIPPTANEMWEAQQDVWLTESILAAIAEVNGNPPTIADAAVRSISELQLVGGNRATIGQAPAASADGAPAAEGGAAPGAGFNFNFRNRRGNRNDGGGGTARTSIDFKPEEEFGSAASAAGGGEGGAPDAPPAMEDPGAAQKKNERRYIDDDPNLPYKTRGFYLKVTMDHRRLPELLGRLTEIRWPVQIVRVHQAELNDDSLAFQQGGGGGGAGGAFRQPAAPRRPRNDFRAGPMNIDAGIDGGAGADQTAARVFAAAMSDPELVEVAIAGIMTIYQPPKDAGTEPGEQPAAEQPAGEQPAPAEGAAPETPVPTPADPASPGTPAESPTTAPTEAPATTPAPAAPADGNTPTPPPTQDGTAAPSATDDSPAPQNNPEPGTPAAAPPASP